MAPLSGVDCAQELHELITDLGRGLVLYPVTDIVEFGRCNETGKAGAHLLQCQRVELLQAVRSPPNENGGLRDLGAFESGGKREIGFGGAVVVQGAVKAGALEFRDRMIDVIRLRPGRQRPGSRTTKASSRIERTPPLIGWSGTRRPIESTGNADGGVSPNLIGLWAHLFEHVEVVLMNPPPPPLPDDGRPPPGRAGRRPRQ